MTTTITNIARVPIVFKRDKVNPAFSYWTHATKPSFLSDAIVAYAFALNDWVDLGKAKKAEIVISKEDQGIGWPGVVNGDGTGLIFVGTLDEKTHSIPTYMEVGLREPLKQLAGHVWVHIQARD